MDVKSSANTDNMDVLIINDGDRWLVGTDADIFNIWRDLTSRIQ